MCGLGIIIIIKMVVVFGVWEVRFFFFCVVYDEDDEEDEEIFILEDDLKNVNFYWVFYLKRD